MTERKKKIDMHVQIASKILSEIKRRGIDKLQDIEDEIMQQGKLSQANKNEMIELMRRETDKQEEYLDKLRLLVIMILCSQDLNEINSTIDSLKLLHQDKFD